MAPGQFRPRHRRNLWAIPSHALRHRCAGRGSRDRRRRIASILGGSALEVVTSIPLPFAPAVLVDAAPGVTVITGGFIAAVEPLPSVAVIACPLVATLPGLLQHVAQTGLRLRMLTRRRFLLLLFLGSTFYLLGLLLVRRRECRPASSSKHRTTTETRKSGAPIADTFAANSRRERRATDFAEASSINGSNPRYRFARCDF